MNSRLEQFRLETLTDEQRRVAERIVLRRSGTRPPMDRAAEYMRGGPRAWMLNPRLGGPLNQLAEEIPRLTLSGRCREIAVLTLGRVYHSDFVLEEHRERALKFGLSEAQIDALCAGNTPKFDTEEEVVVLDTILAMTARGDLDDTEFGRAESVLGKQKIFELMFLVGFYRLVTLQLAVFRLG